MLIIVGHTEISNHSPAPGACLGRDIFPIIENMLKGANDGFRKPHIDVQIFSVQHADSLQMTFGLIEELLGLKIRYRL